MKIRKNFVSNSSSTSFLVNLSDLSEKAQAAIDNLTDRSGEWGRSTGKITDVDGWLKMFEEDYGDDFYPEVREALKENKDAILVRESDEGMGGDFPEGLWKEVEEKALVEFEYHIGRSWDDIGRSWDDIGGDETGSQFKENVD